MPRDDAWRQQGKRRRRARLLLAARTTWPTPCALCGQPLNVTDDWHLGHIHDRESHPHLMWDPNNHRVECPTCSHRGGAHIANAKRRRRADIDDRGPDEPRESDIPLSSGGSPALRGRTAQKPPGVSGTPPVSGTFGPERHTDGWVLPRIAPMLPPGVSFDVADGAIRWIEAQFGEGLMGWQRHVLRLALATVPGRGGRPRLLYSRVVVRLARQQGKTYLARRLLAWRLLMGEQVFGQPQRIINTHPDGGQSVRLMEPVARHFGFQRGGKPGFTKQTFMASWFPGGVESEVNAAWFARAMTTNALTGNQGITFAYVDELQDAREQQVTEALGGSLSGSRVVSAQRWFTGTGEKPGSTLLRRLRRAQHGPGMCWVEWSAPRGTRVDDEAGWLWASPDWSDARGQYLSEQLDELGEREFAANFLLSDEALTRQGWVPEMGLSGSRRAGLVPAAGGVAAVESHPQGLGFAAVAWRADDGRVGVVARQFGSVSEAWDWAESFAPGAWLCGYSLRATPRALDVEAEPRSNQDTAGDLPEWRRMLLEGELWWDGDTIADNADRVRVRDADTQSGVRLVAEDGVTTGGVRCAAWAVCAVQRLAGAALSA